MINFKKLQETLDKEYTDEEVDLIIKSLYDSLSEHNSRYYLLPSDLKEIHDNIILGVVEELKKGRPEGNPQKNLNHSRTISN